MRFKEFVKMITPKSKEHIAPALWYRFSPACVKAFGKNISRAQIAKALTRKTKYIGRIKGVKLYIGHPKPNGITTNNSDRN